VSDINIDLPSIVNPWVAPIIRRRYTGIIGTDRYLFEAGFNNDDKKVPNVFEVLFAQFNLTTDATVANRFPNIRVRSEGNAVFDRLYATAITASDNEIFTVQRLGYAVQASPIAVTTAKYVGLNTKALLFSGKEQLDCFIDNGQAGDSWELSLTLHCLNRELDIIPRYVRQYIKSI